MSQGILFVQFMDPVYYPPALNAALLCRRAGLDVALVGYRAAGVEPLTAPLELENRIAYEKASTGHFALYRDYARYILRVLTHCAKRRPAFVYAADTFAAIPALLCSLLFGVRVFYVEYDAPGSPDGWTARVRLWARRIVARNALACVAPSGARADLLARETGCSSAKIIVVMNCPMREEIRTAHPPHDRFRLYYHGTVNWYRIPPSIIGAMARLPDEVELWLVGYEAPGVTSFRGELETLAEAVGVGAHRIKVCGAMSRPEMMNLCAQCSIGLCLMPSTITDVNLIILAGASNKAFDYLCCGLPLLVNNWEDWRELYVNAGVAKACDADNEDDVARAIREYMVDPGRRIEAGQVGQQLIGERWNYDTQFQPVLELCTRFDNVIHPSKN